MSGKILTILFIFVICSTVSGQDPHFSQMHSALFFSNPAVISLNEYPQAGLNYRNQWPGINSTFVTYSAYFINPLNQLNSSFGLSLLHDVLGDGAISKTMINGIYSYTIKASDKVNISGGLQLSYIFRKINENKFIFETDITQGGNYSLGYDNAKSGFFDFSIGFLASVGKNFSTGISAHHVTKPQEGLGKSEWSKLNYKIVFHASGLVPLRKSYQNSIFLEPGLQFTNQGKYNELLYGGNLKIFPFECGLWARNNINFNFDAFIIMLGFSYNNCTFRYSYDINLKAIKFFSPGMAAHEVTFFYNFKYKGKRKWAQ